MINFVILQPNFHQFEPIVRLAHELQAHQVNFKHCVVVRGEHGKSRGLYGSSESKEIKELEKAFREAVKVMEQCPAGLSDLTLPYDI